MTESTIDKELESLDGEHNPETVPDSGFGKVPDNDYVARLDALYISKSKKGRLQCVWDFEIINGPFAFRKIMKFSGMDSADGLDFLTNDLRRVGISNFKWTNVSKQFPSVLDKLIQLTLKTKTKKDQAFQSVYIQGIIDQNKLLVSKDLKATAAEDDVPF